LNWINTQNRFAAKHSSVFDLFYKEYFEKHPDKVLLLCFVLAGNTIDGV
jgi:hypothetical protein